MGIYYVFEAKIPHHSRRGYVDDMVSELNLQKGVRDEFIC